MAAGLRGHRVGDDDAGVTAIIRSEGARSLRVALLVMAVLAAAVTAIEIALIWSAHQPFEWLLSLYSAQGLADVLIGAVAWDRRAGNRTGALLCVAGMWTLASAIGNVTNPILVAAGSIAGEALIAAVLHLVLAFPSGRLRSRPGIALVAAGYAVVLVFTALQYVYGPGAVAFPGWGLHPQPGIVAVSGHLRTWIGVAIVLVACGLKARQVYAERGPAARPQHLGVFIYGIATLLFLPFSAQVLRPVFGLSPYGLFALQLAVFSWVPVVFGFAVWRGGFSRTGNIEQLGAWLAGGTFETPGLRDALAATLGDQSVQLLGPGALPLATADGQPGPAGMPGGAGRASMPILGPAGVLATVVYNQTLIADPEVVRAAGQLAGLAIERDRLTAELLASRQEIQESRARILSVADSERRRLAHDLHDLLQARLILAALHAGQLAADPGLDDGTRRVASQLRAELQDAITELRGRVHGLMPPLLIERNLSAAIEELADRLPLPCRLDLDDGGLVIPAEVASTAYFVVAEAVTNTIKHAQATVVDLTLRHDGNALRLAIGDDGIGGARTAGGGGLRGLADRVEALDGRIELHSPATGGTRLTVVLPCGS